MWTQIGGKAFFKGKITKTILDESKAARELILIVYYPSGNNFKALMISTTLMTPYISEDEKFSKLIERKEFIAHPILPLVADFAKELGIIEKKSVDKELKSKIETQIKKKREYIKSVLKEPAYRFNDKFALEK